jgi:hypothetical protein
MLPLQTQMESLELWVAEIVPWDVFLVLGMVALSFFISNERMIRLGAVWPNHMTWSGVKSMLCARNTEQLVKCPANLTLPSLTC